MDQICKFGEQTSWFLVSTYIVLQKHKQITQKNEKMLYQKQNVNNKMWDWVSYLSKVKTFIMQKPNFSTFNL